jgi:UDP-N-acetylmuramate--alanine ligase
MTVRNLHFMGVGGVGMCGLAEVLYHQGLSISGCDVADSERTRHLQGLGVVVRRGHDPSHLDGVDALVTTAAVASVEAELAAARERGLIVVRRAEMLAELMRMRRGVAVAGTHGKTTTTALIGHLLTAAGEDPTIIAGGRVHGLGSHARVGSGSLLVSEADEYDRSFLELAPHIAVITNLEPEHLDCYGDRATLEAAFASFANRTSVFGAVVVCADDPRVRDLRTRIRRRVIGYGTSADADLRLRIVDSDPGGTRFEITRGDRRLGPVHLPLAGAHNARNAAAAIAVGLELGLDFDVLAAACGSFSGVARRFEVRGERRGVTVVDDYAHHPTEIAAVFEAAHQAMPGRRLVAVFQPHLFSRTREFARDFATALLGAEVAMVLPIYPARERPIDGITAQLVVDEAVRLGHPRVLAGPPPDAAVDELESLLEAGDVLMTLGAGDVDRVGGLWLEVTQ